MSVTHVLTRFFVLPILLSVCGAWPARSEEILRYEVYGGGIHAMSATLKIDDTPGRYNLDLKASTIGFLKRMAPWSGEFSTFGWTLDNGDRQPENHISSSTWKNETESKEYRYTRSGKFISYRVIEAGKDKTPEKLTADLTPQSMSDVLSVALVAMDQLKKNGVCSASKTVFDGDRNFTMIFADKGDENLPTSKYNLFKGIARACAVEVKPGAGKWHKKPRGWLSIQEQGRKAGTMPTVWFARLSADPAEPYLPVRIRVKTDYGTLFMHLVGVTGVKDDKMVAPARKP